VSRKECLLKMVRNVCWFLWEVFLEPCCRITSLGWNVGDRMVLLDDLQDRRKKSLSGKGHLRRALLPNPVSVYN